MSSSTGLDPRFTLCFPLQEYFVDKDTGLPLAGGVVTFYDHNSQSVLKPIYTLSGNGPFSDASYVQLPNPLILSAVGTFIDNNGNDIIPYLFPYDGTPSTSTGIVDLYYITVYSSSGIEQFTRQAWPNIVASSTGSSNGMINYIPNGQFLLHNNFPVSVTNANAVPSNATVTSIAQGGWYFQVPTGTSSVNSVSFASNTPTSNPDVSANPRFAVNVQCITPSNTDTFKDLVVTFPDVNKFATDSLLSNYTFAFQGTSNNSGSIPVQIRLLKYFGSNGGSTSTDTAFGSGTLNITQSSPNAIYNIPGSFGSNASETIGPNNDDYLQIAIRFPNQIFSATLSDFILTDGNVVITGFPQTTNAEFLSKSTAGWLPTPNPDGSSLYLPIKLGAEGFFYDNSEVGKVVSNIDLADFNGTSISTISNELIADGSQYLTSGYSPLGIPYYRLQKKLIFNSSRNMPIFGTGLNFVSSIVNTSFTPRFTMLNNTFGTGIGAADGLIPTNFTFHSVHADNGSSINVNSFINGSTTGVMKGIITSVADGSGGGATGITFSESRIGSSNNYNIWTFNTTACTISSLASKYFTFTANSSNYYIWFTYNGTGTDPAPGGTGIKINLFLNDTLISLAIFITAALNGGSISGIDCISGSSITPNAWFNFTTSNGNNYYAWYNINGTGTDPKPVGYTLGIPVIVSSSATAAQVAADTVMALNATYFAVPDLRGAFLRGYDPNSYWDLDSNIRFANNYQTYGNNLGSFEVDMFLSHTHSASSSSSSPGFLFHLLPDVPGGGGSPAYGTGTGSTQPISVSTSTTISNTGGTETRPINAYVSFAIKY